ncbi:WD40 repeat-like protein [Sanghuangporus baumii]|uniref:WD40 repeat-like protein n=1 Tax=Sanghuangporus baumii TaxID=108892 RepID=A0A9Q5HS51_SANBA|nr:WD40 repeat-like protein [Sanghuangporus baumii]
MKRNRTGGHPASRISQWSATPLNPNAQLHAIFDSGFPYSKKLRAHKSCVNAITFSRGDGRWLASAGDDLRVLLWDFHQENVEGSSTSLTGHRSNIFCLDFSAQNQYLYSGSIDEKILKYDVSTATNSTSGGPVQTFTTHEDNVRGISCHPENDDLFLSVGEDGLIALHDSRIFGGCAGSFMNECEVTDVRYHPRADKLFFTTDQRGNVCLRDIRMAFGDRSTTSGLSVNGDSKGTHHLPTIYSISDPIPLAVCSGTNLPDGSPVPEGERTYKNACTMKHGSFGSPSGDIEDMYYTTGSDDFRAYVWKLPDTVTLQEARRTLSRDEFNNEPPRTIAYARSMADDTRYIPVDLCTPLSRLQGRFLHIHHGMAAQQHCSATTGHDSIVNSSIIHPHLPQIATCGVERHITIHSPTPTAPNMTFTRTSETVRALPTDDPQVTRRYLLALLSGHNNQFDSDGSVDVAERNTIDFFDGIIRDHDDINVFTAGTKVHDTGTDDEEISSDE